jgi:hypothetical protein
MRADASGLLVTPLTVVGKDVRHFSFSGMAIPAGSRHRFISAVDARRDRCVMFSGKKTGPNRIV